MSVVPIRWRPSSARDLEAGRALLARAIAAWQAEWFVAPELEVEAVALLDPHDALTLPTESLLRWSCGADVWLSAEPQRLAAIVNRALDLPKSFALTSESRPALLGDVETKLLDEFFDALRIALSPALRGAERIASTDAAGPPRMPYGGAHFRLVSTSGETVLTIVCGVQTLWACVPIQSSTQAQFTLALEPRSEAINDSHVSIHAMLGRCELTVPQLATLAVGDVIGLNRPVTDSIPLVLARAEEDRATHTAVATGRPGRHAGKLSIQLTSIARPYTP